MVSAIAIAESKGRAEWCWTEHFILKNIQLQCDIQSAERLVQDYRSRYTESTPPDKSQKMLFSSTYQESRYLWGFFICF